jgi:hypothetical protein
MPSRQLPTTWQWVAALYALYSSNSFAQPIVAWICQIHSEEHQQSRNKVDWPDHQRKAKSLAAQDPVELANIFQKAASWAATNSSTRDLSDDLSKLLRETTWTSARWYIREVLFKAPTMRSLIVSRSSTGNCTAIDRRGPRPLWGRIQQPSTKRWRLSTLRCIVSPCFAQCLLTQGQSLCLRS